METLRIHLDAGEGLYRLADVLCQEAGDGGPRRDHGGGKTVTGYGQGNA